MLPQLLLDGILNGASFALMAAGLSLVLGVVKIVNLSHGAFFTMGAYAAWAVSAQGAAYRPSAAILAAGVAFGMGTFLGKHFVHPVRFHPFSVTVGTLAVSLLFEQAAQFAWGPHPLLIASGPAIAGPFGTSVRPWSAVAFLAATGLYLGLHIFLSSRWGISLKLIAEEEEIAASVGMNVGRIRCLTLGAGSAMAAVAGALLAPSAAIVPHMGRGPLILSLIVVIASGMDRLGAGFLLAMILGLLSNLSAFYLAPEWSYILLLAIVCGLLALRPSGLSGAVLSREA